MKHISLALLVIGCGAAFLQAETLVYEAGFEAPGYELGPLNGQDGWTIKQASALNSRIVVVEGETNSLPEAPEGKNFLQVRSHHNTSASAQVNFAEESDSIFGGIATPFTLSLSMAWDDTDVASRTWYRFVSLTDLSVSDNGGIRFGFGSGLDSAGNTLNGVYLNYFDGSENGGWRVLDANPLGEGELIAEALENVFYRFDISVRPEASVYDLSVYLGDELIAAVTDVSVRFPAAEYSYNLLHAQVIRDATGGNAELGNLYIDDIRVATAIPEPNHILFGSIAMVVARLAIRRRRVLSS